MKFKLQRLMKGLSILPLELEKMSTIAYVDTLQDIIKHLSSQDLQGGYLYIITPFVSPPPIPIEQWCCDESYFYFQGVPVLDVGDLDAEGRMLVLNLLKAKNITAQDVDNFS